MVGSSVPSQSEVKIVGFSFTESYELRSDRQKDAARNRVALSLYGGFPKLGVPLWGPKNEHYSILASILGSPYFKK